MLLVDARRPARVGASGELVPLDEQDPSLWDRALIAEAMVAGPAAGLRALAALEEDARLRDHHRLHAARGGLLERAGEVAGALDAYRAAAERTNSIAERDHLLLRMTRLSDADGRPSARDGTR